MASDSDKITQGRSPAYPYIGLGKAVERAVKVSEAGVGRNAYPPETFYKIWKLGSQSSGARQTMAALNHFGLVDYVGRGKDRKVKLSDLALKIVLDKVPNSEARQNAIKEAAMKPRIHLDLWEKYGPTLPDDVVLNTYLTLECSYNSDAADTLIGEYKDTLEFSKLTKPGDMPVVGDGEPINREPPEKGDLIQWESEGVLRFEEPKRVREIRENEGEKWVFVEGSQTGIPMNEAVIQQKGPDIPRSRRPPTLPEEPVDDLAPPKGRRKAIFPVSDGDVSITFPENLSVEGLEELGQYLDIFLKKEKRVKQSASQTTAEKTDPDQ